MIAQILTDFDLYKSVISNAASYMEIVRTEMRQLKEDNKQVDCRTHIFSGLTQHEEYIKTLVGFLEFLVINSRSITLRFEHIQDMFKIFVTDSVTQTETKEFFDFLTKENPNAKTRERLNLLDEKLRFQVFTKIMCND